MIFEVLLPKIEQLKTINLYKRIAITIDLFLSNR
jgi:hypothetical protein